MPVSLNELLEQGVKDGLAITDDASRDAAVEALKKHLNPVYLAINNLAYGAAQAKHTQETTEAKAAVTKAEERATAAEKALRDYQDTKPDVKTINEQWETREAELKETHKKALKKLDDRIRSGWVERDQAALKAEMVKLGVKDYTADIMSRDPAGIPVRGDYDDNGALSVRQAGQQIPLAPGSGQSHLSMLAAEYASRIPKDDLVSHGDSGSGVSGGGHPGNGDKAFFDKIVDTAKREQQGESPRVSLQERMKNRQ